MKKSHKDTVQELLITEQDWCRAHREMDLRAIRAMLDDEYTQLKSDGKLVGKQELIENYSKGNRYWEIAESEPVKIQIIGDVALLFGKWRGKGENNQKSFDYYAYFLAVYRRSVDGWKLIADTSLDR